jgi:hypothetical protein
MSGPMLKLPHPVILDECRLDVLVEGADGKLVRPIVTILLSEIGCGLGISTTGILPYSPTCKSAIERHFCAFADSLKKILEAGR